MVIYNLNKRDSNINLQIYHNLTPQNRLEMLNKFKNNESGGVLLTTYRSLTYIFDNKETTTKDQTKNSQVLEKIDNILKTFQFDYIFLDEGHKIKNKNTIIAKNLRKIKSKNKFILTGTPGKYYKII
jgi:SNF2 family DNA or RNA helicase